MTIVRKVSPNHGPRRGVTRPNMIVLHYTAMETANVAIERLCDPIAEVSAHYVICEKGHVTQLVDEEARAWHAGRSKWGAAEDVNSHSIGIELANQGDHPFPDAQMSKLEDLLRDIMARREIVPERVVGHSDIAITRKTDPGPRFDWARLAQGGLSIWPSACMSIGDFLEDAAMFGYDVSLGEDAVLAAFRLRFRPHASGPLHPADREMMHALAMSYPVDLSIKDG